MPKRLTAGERLVKIETDIDYIKQEVTGTCKKLDNFINSADNKYAHKEEFNDFKKEISNQRSNTRSWVQWIPSVLMGLITLVVLFLR